MALAQIRTAATVAPVSPVLANPAFRRLLCSGLVSGLGEQFTAVAMPWLVMGISRDPLALSTVLVVLSLPRVLLLPIAGTIVDRSAPGRILVHAKLATAILLGILAALVAWGQPPFWLICCLALLISCAGAFGLPCSAALLPSVLSRSQLPKANNLIMGVAQAAALAGPLAAGTAIALLSPAVQPGMPALAAAFCVHAVLLVIASCALLSMRSIGREAARAAPMPAADAARRLLADRPLITCCAYWMICCVFVSGPIQVGLPLLAREQLAVGAASFGILLAIHGLGALVGLVFASMARRAPQALGRDLLLIDLLIAVLIGPLGWVASMWQAALLLLAIGMLNGTLQARLFTWVQLRLPVPMLGRATSLFALMMALAGAVSALLAGSAMRHLSASSMYLAASAVLVAVIILTSCFTDIRLIRDHSDSTHQ